MAQTTKSKKMSSAAQPKRPKHRSPNYPVLGLQKAVERAKLLYEHAKNHYVPIGVALVHWSFKPLSASGNQNVAALKSYGLVEVVGEGDKRQVRISDAARRIILDSPDRDELLKQAALRPSLHAQIWKKYDGDLPTDDVIKHYLIFDLKFNEDSVGSFIGQFKGTISFAKLSSDDKVGDEDGKEEDDDAEEQGSMEKLDDTGKITKTKPPVPPPGLKDFPLYLSNSQKAVLYVPSTMSQKDFDLLKKQLENSLAVMEAISVTSDEKQDL